MLFEDVIKALKAGLSVMQGDKVVYAEGIEYPWQEPTIRVRNTNGSSYPANDKDLNYFKVVSNVK
jgi:hypothetical protein